MNKSNQRYYIAKQLNDELASLSNIYLLVYDIDIIGDTFKEIKSEALVDDELSEDENKSVIEKKLIVTNNLLEKQNSELRQILKEILAKDIYSTPIITGEIKEKLNKILNEDYSEEILGNPFSTYEDLLMMLNVQCALNEAQLNHNS